MQDKIVPGQTKPSSHRSCFVLRAAMLLLLLFAVVVVMVNFWLDHSSPETTLLGKNQGWIVHLGVRSPGFTWSRQSRRNGFHGNGHGNDDDDDSVRPIMYCRHRHQRSVAHEILVVLFWLGWVRTRTHTPYCHVFVLLLVFVRLV